MGDPGTDPAETGFRPPLLAGRYVVQSRLGRGGTSAVYLAFDLKLRAWRAAKVMHPSEARDPELRERFAREAVVMARLDHPNVVRVVDVATDVELPHLVMEFLEGGTAVDYVKAHGAMHPALAVQVVLDLCGGLSALHEIGGVHRDVKPHNLVFDRSGKCKLTDFGIARIGAAGTDDTALDDLDSHITQVGTVMGTAAYMAPEQRVDASRVDRRADVFGVGATLFTLLTARSSADLCLATADDERFAGIPRPLLDVLLRACAYRPGERPPDTVALARLLDAVPLPPLPRSTPPLVSGVEELPARPPHRLSPGQVRGLTELISGGAIRETYDPSGATTGASLRPREHAPIRRAEATWSKPIAARREEATELFAPTPQPEEATVVLRGPEEVARFEDPPEAVDIRPSAQATLPVLDRAQAPRPRLWFDPRLLVAALGILIVGLGLCAAVGSVLLARGAREVGQAERVVLGAQERLWVLIDHHQPVVGDLGRLGADRQALEDALVAFQTAAPGEKPQRAEAFLTLLDQSWKSLKSDPAVHPSTVGAMADLEEGWEAYDEAVATWRDAAGGITGALAVTVGLAAPPPE